MKQVSSRSEFINFSKKKHTYIIGLRVRVMVFSATFNNISVISLWLVLLVERSGVPWRKPPTYRKSLTNFTT